jgi:hypothetical protein
MALSLDNNKTYQIIAHPAQVPLAKRLVESNPAKFQFHETSWGKFKDGTDNIEVGGMENPHNAFFSPHRLLYSRPSQLQDFHLLSNLSKCERTNLNYARVHTGFYPVNHVRGNHVLFLASFHNNDATLSQFHVLNMLCESFVESMVRPPRATRDSHPETSPPPLHCVLQQRDSSSHRARVVRRPAHARTHARAHARTHARCCQHWPVRRAETFATDGAAAILARWHNTHPLSTRPHNFSAGASSTKCRKILW